MNNSHTIDPALIGSIGFYSSSFYDHIKNLSWPEIQKISNAASQITLEHAVIRDKSGEFPKFELPTYSEKKSIVFCVAVVSAAIVWSQKHLADNPLPNSPLLDASFMGYRLWKSSQQPFDNLVKN